MLAQLLEQQDLLSIILAIVLARTALPLLLITTPYVRQEGIASLLVQHIPQRDTRILLIGITFLTLLLSGFALFTCILILFLLLRYVMEQRLGGTTGDTAGAMVELLETAVLITAVII
jgi:adenosylcobinamide-GDP ribazoletransferase